MSFTIEQITLHEIRMPLREPFRISSGSVSRRRILLVELRDGDGVTVWSECVAGEQPNYSSETIDTAWLALRLYVAPRILKREIASPEDVHAILAEDFRGHLMAKAAVEMGCWALEAVRQETSLAQLLGGTWRKIPTGISLGIQDSPMALVDRAQQAVEEGYRKIKIKIQSGADLDYLRSVREALGEEAPLMADANSAYRVEDADYLARLDEIDLMMLEQPLAADDLVRHAELQKQLHTPICLDESITGPDKVEDMMKLGSGRIVNIKPGRVGGFTAAKAIHHLCARHEIPVWCGGMLESGIGRAYNVALASLPNFTLPGDLSPSRRYWQEDIVKPEWVMDHVGLLTVPWDEPGIGVEVDRDFVGRLTVHSQTLV